jgi:hypothetical protein
MLTYVKREKVRLVPAFALCQSTAPCAAGDVNQDVGLGYAAI